MQAHNRSRDVLEGGFVQNHDLLIKKITCTNVGVTCNEKLQIVAQDSFLIRIC